MGAARKPTKSSARAQGVLLLFNERNERLQRIIADIENILRGMDMEVTVIAYVDQENLKDQLPFTYFNKKELDPLGRPRGPWVDQLREQSWRYVINVSPHACLPLDWLVRFLHARVKVGLQDAPHIYDIILLGHTQSQDGLVAQMESILLTLNLKSYANT
jgi:hypothetical protein